MSVFLNNAGRENNLLNAGCKQSFKNIDFGRWGERRIGQNNVRQVQNPNESMNMVK